MIGAMGDCHDLSGIYGMMRINPETNNVDLIMSVETKDE